ncbi:uncharacterized protein [Amphiura filiformis]|uniref:uncharacterized protein n=1 Tax=Amphiura filiformis TaxID=82378 RepID=UPI003B219393
MTTEVHLFLLSLLILGSTGSIAQNRTQVQSLTVDLSSEESTFEEGQFAVLTCTVNGSFHEDNDTILIQKTNDKNMSTLATEGGLDPQAPSNVKFIGYTSLDGVHKVFVSFDLVNRNDRGEYVCNVVRQSDDKNEAILASDRLKFDVLYLPSDNPNCVPVAPEYHDGETVTLKCSSEAGNPAVPVTWYERRNGTSLIELEGQTSGQRDDVTISELSLKLTFDMDGVAFDCIRENFEDLSSAQFCSVNITVLNKTLEITVKDPGDDGDNGGHFDNDPNNKSGTSVQYIVGAVVGIVLIITAVVIIVVLVKKNNSGTSQNVSQRTISEPVPQMEYSKLSTCENGELQASKSDEKSSDGPIYAETQKKKTSKTSKKYPDPPDYPRPAKNQSISAERPYVNTEIGASLTTASQSDKPNEYANTLDVGCSVKRKGGSTGSESKDGKTKTTEYANLQDPTVSQPTPPDGK